MIRILLASCFVVTWSSGFVGTALAGEGVDWRPLLAWRYVVTAVALIAAWFVTRGRPSRTHVSRREVCRQVALGLLAHVVFLGGVFAAADAGLDAGLSALVCALQPLLVTFASRAVFGDPLRRVQVLGLTLGMAGVACSLGGIDVAAMSGIAFAIASLLALSASAMLERHWSPQTPLLLSVTIQSVTAAVTFMTLAASTSSIHLPVTTASLQAILWLVVLSGLGGYSTYLMCLRTLGATTTSTLLYLTPSVTMLWAWMMFAQRPNGLQWLGLTIVMLAVALTLVDPRDASSPTLSRTNGP